MIKPFLLAVFILFIGVFPAYAVEPVEPPGEDQLAEEVPEEVSEETTEEVPEETTEEVISENQEQLVQETLPEETTPTDPLEEDTLSQIEKHLRILVFIAAAYFVWTVIKIFYNLFNGVFLGGL